MFIDYQVPQHPLRFFCWVCYYSQYGDKMNVYTVYYGRHRILECDSINFYAFCFSCYFFDNFSINKYANKTDEEEKKDTGEKTKN